jgi:hypothetical protein
MAGTADLKVDTLLTLQADLAIIKAPRGLHQPECLDQEIGFKPRSSRRFKPFRTGWRCKRRHHMKIP